MKRRSFLQMLAAATAALVAPKVVAKANAVELVVGRHIFVSSTTASFGYGKGTFNRPFATIREAVNVASPGDVIVLKSSHTLESGACIVGEKIHKLRIVMCEPY